MNTWTWKNEVYEVINELGGRAHLHEIYKRAEERQKKVKGKISDGNKASIRDAIHKQTSDSDVFEGKEDLLYSVEGKGSGIWAIRFDSNENVNENDKGNKKTDSSKHYNRDMLHRLPEELDKSEINRFIEGSVKQIFVNAYERNTKARKSCLKFHGTKCAICGFDFGEIYGSEFEGKIHVHHKIALHEIKEEYEVDSKEDLIPVCPNCHLVLHSKTDGTYTVEEVRNFLKIQKEKMKFYNKN